MKLCPKLRFTLFVTSLLFFYSLQASAQYPGMGAFRAQQSRQFANQQMQTQMQMMANMNWRQNAGQGDSYYVTFKDSTQKKVVSYMYYDSVQRKNFLILVDKKFPKSDSVHRFRKIYPEQTLSLSSGQEEWLKYGFPTDSCWTFKVITGAITVYAKNTDYLVITKTPLLSSEVSDFSPAAIIGIQLNDGPVEKLTKETVSKMVSQDPKAVALLEKRGMCDAVERYNKDIEKNKKQAASPAE
jgi:hypothetical protein